jgi:hypothetical protein
MARSDKNPRMDINLLDYKSHRYTRYTIDRLIFRWMEPVFFWQLNGVKITKALAKELEEKYQQK